MDPCGLQPAGSTPHPATRFDELMLALWSSGALSTVRPALLDSAVFVLQETKVRVRTRALCDILDALQALVQAYGRPPSHRLCVRASLRDHVFGLRAARCAAIPPQLTDAHTRHQEWNQECRKSLIVMNTKTFCTGTSRGRFGDDAEQFTSRGAAPLRTGSA